MKKKFIQDFNNKIQGGDNLNDWGEIKTVEQPSPDESYFIKDTIKELSKRGKDFQGRIDVYNTIREVMNDLNDLCYRYLFMYTENNDLTGFYGSTYRLMRELKGKYGYKSIDTHYNDMKELIKELQSKTSK